MDFNTIKFEKKLIESWNNTLSSKAYILYPKNILELKKLISIIKKDKKKYLIRTGSCSYDSKSINPDLETIVISLKYLLISDLVRVIRDSSSNTFVKTENTSSKKYLFVKLLYFTVFIISLSRILEKFVEFFITEIINLPCFLET